jgi:uncharacterized protein YijF (DUF1287 family)/vancomycin permeability regulator SanA
MLQMKRVSLGLLTIGIIATIWSNLLVRAESKHTYDQVSQVPRNKVGLVLGCGRYLRGGYNNLFFRNRIKAASRLIQSGKVDYILVSGDNHRQGYDETSDMKQALVELGVPPGRIVCDYAGFSTLDSIVRSKEVFGQRAITIISQRFHNERAIYLAKAYGMEAVGYNADDVQLKWAAKTYLREIGARVKAIWDTKIARRSPRFLGEPVVIGAAAVPPDVGLRQALVQPEKLVAAAKSQIGVTVSYDPAYRKLKYPGGGIAKETGVCCDVVIRALREQGLDLQKEVHEDMQKDFSAYPQKWGLKQPDANIDHRRVPNLMTFFHRKGYAQPATNAVGQYATGDVVAWDLGGNITHIGIVSDRRNRQGSPLVIHNIGRGTQEEDGLFQFRIIGHYRLQEPLAGQERHNSKVPCLGGE